MVANKLLSALNEPFLVDGHDLRVSASIGISVYPQDGNDAETLLRLADIAMYRAKQNSSTDGEHIAFYSQDMNKGMQERMRIESGLRQALGNGQLLLHYQPKFEISSGKIIGAEALVRWMHPERGLVPPSEFIPLAEATGLVVQVGEWVLEAACAQAQAWKEKGLPPVRLAVNVSAREFTSALPGRVMETLQRYGLEPSWLELEITESTLMHNIERVIGIMDRLTAAGITLSLDVLSEALPDRHVEDRPFLHYRHPGRHQRLRHCQHHHQHRPAIEPQGHCGRRRNRRTTGLPQGFGLRRSARLSVLASFAGARIRTGASAELGATATNGRQRRLIGAVGHFHHPTGNLFARRGRRAGVARIRLIKPG
jgi:hypothetical protein